MKRARNPTLLVGTLALAARSAAQGGGVQPGRDDGPVVVGTPTASWSGLELMRIDAAVEYRFQRLHDQIKEDARERRTRRESRHRELLDLTGEASVGHRNLLHLTGTVQLGLEDVFTRDDADPLSGHESDFVSLYDLSALFFGTSDLPTTVYARRQQSLLDRPFAGTIDQTLTEEGIGTRFQTESTATSVQYFHREDRLTGDFGDLNSTVRQHSLAVQSGISFAPTSRLDLGYTFDRISERQSGGYTDDYDRHDVNAVHTWAFGGEDAPHDLRSSLRLYDQSGKQEQQRLRWDEVLTLRHSPRLESRYNLVADVRDVREGTQQLLRGEASVKHRLFESLTSTASVGAQRLEAPGGFTSDDVFVTGQLDYTKRVPMGRLDAAAGASFDAQTNSERGSTLRVVDEAYTFIDGFPLVLPRRHIVPGSVVVTGSAGFPVYQPGVDYTATYFADRAEIRGIVGGGIANGQTLRVSYDIGPDAASDIDTTTTALSVRYTITEGDLRGLAFYGTHRTLRHSQRGGDPDLLPLDNVTDTLLGIEFRRAEFEARYEYNIHDSDLDGYTRHRLQALYHAPLGPGSSLTAEWTREFIDFTDQDNRVTFDRGALRATWRVDEHLDLNAGLDYRNEDSSLRGHSQGFDQTVGLSWRRGQTSAYASFRNSMLDGPASRQDSQFFQIGLRRTF